MGYPKRDFSKINNEEKEVAKKASSYEDIIQDIEERVGEDGDVKDYSQDILEELHDNFFINISETQKHESHLMVFYHLYNKYLENQNPVDTDQEVMKDYIDSVL